MFPSPQAASLQRSPGLRNKRKDRKRASLISWKARRERSAVLPRPGGLNLYHAFHGKHEAPWCLAAKNHPAAIGSRVKQFRNSFGPGTGSGPGAAPCESDLACQSRHHSDRLAGPLTPFRRQGNPRLTLSRYLVFFIILRNAPYFNRKKYWLLCVLLRLRRGNFNGRRISFL